MDAAVDIIPVIGSSETAPDATTAARAQALMSLAAIAPGLSEAELRVALYLATIQDADTHTAKASSRELAEATRVSRYAIQRALDGLARRSLIAARQGGGARTSSYLLNWTQTTCIQGGLTTRPPEQQSFPEVASPRGHLSEPPAPLDIDRSISDSILDRVFTARPQHFQDSELVKIRSYAYKWLTLQKGMENCQPPDNQVCARIAAAAEGVNRAVDWITEHMRDHQARTAEYIVVWMLQDLHGIAPNATRQRRTTLRLVKPDKTGTSPAAAAPAPPAPESPAPQFADDLVRQAAAGVKTFR